MLFLMRALSFLHDCEQYRVEVPHRLPFAGASILEEKAFRCLPNYKHGAHNALEDCKMLLIILIFHQRQTVPTALGKS